MRAFVSPATPAFGGTLRHAAPRAGSKTPVPLSGFIPLVPSLLGSLSLVALPASASVSSAEVAASVKAALDATQSALGQAAEVGAEFGSAAGAAASYVKPYADAYAPAVKSAAQSAVAAATPLLQSGVAQLQRSGVDVDGAVKSAATVAKEAAPVLSGGAYAVSSFLSSTSPATLATELGALALLLLLAPLAVPIIAGALRGYASDVSPLIALELMSNDNNAVMVDLRQDVAIRGVPALPKGALSRLCFVPFDTIEDRALRSAISDPSALEAESTARIIASLKKVSRGSPVLLFDSNRGESKQVARKLAALGFSRVNVVEGGVDAWVRSGLQTTRQL